jgi:hypothetical protein
MEVMFCAGCHRVVKKKRNFQPKQKAQILPDVGENKSFFSNSFQPLIKFPSKTFMSEIAFFTDNELWSCNHFLDLFF